MSDHNKNHFIQIDIFRGIAILLVFLYHTQFSFFPSFESYTYNDYFINLESKKQLILNILPSSFGWSGVQLFLVISGFLIHLSYLKTQNKFNFLTFYSKRFWRIYPTYLIVLLTFCFINDKNFYFNSQKGWFDVASHLLFTYNFSDQTIFTINPFWSLALEVQLYLLYPLFLWGRNKFGLYTSLIVVLTISFLSIILGSFTNNFNSIYTYKMSVLTSWGIWCLGAFLAENVNKGKKIFPKVNKLQLSLLLLILICSKFVVVTNLFINYIAAFFWLVCLDSYLKRPLKKGVLIKILILLGTCSYSFYLIHQPLLPFLFNIIKFASGTSLRFINIIPVFVFLFTISYLLYLAFESQFIKIGTVLRSNSNRRNQL